jgi:hypothetical protein
MLYPILFFHKNFCSLFKQRNKKKENMKYQINTCIQCGTEFKRTNARHIYCSVACRVSAHRDRHGYEQPIFTYPSIRAVEAIKALDMDGLARINLYASLYLNSLQQAGKVIPPPQREMDLQEALLQYRMENENDEATNEITSILEPMSQLLHLVKQIKADTPAS